MRSIVVALALLVVALPALAEPPGLVAKSIQPPGGMFKHDIVVKSEVLPMPSEDDVGMPAGDITTMTIDIKGKRNAETQTTEDTCSTGTCPQAATPASYTPALSDTGQVVTYEPVRYTRTSRGGGGLFSRLRSSTCRGGSCQ